MRLALAAIACASLATASALTGCGGSGTTVVATTTVRETQDPLPELPNHWKSVRARGQGIGFGLPPDWEQGGACLGGSSKQSDKAADAVVACSPNLLTTVSIAADRSPEALALEPQAFAGKALEALNHARYGGSLQAGTPQTFGDLYEGAVIEARGQLEGRTFPSEVRLIVLRREDLANFTVVIATNAKRAKGLQSRLADQLVKTIRDQPSGRSG